MNNDEFRGICVNSIHLNYCKLLVTTNILFIREFFSCSKRVVIPSIYKYAKLCLFFVVFTSRSFPRSFETSEAIFNNLYIQPSMFRYLNIIIKSDELYFYKGKLKKKKKN